MNYATQYHIGNNQNSRTAKTKTIAPTVRRVRLLDAKTQRCKRSTKRPTQIRTDCNVANGILKCTFLPKLKEPKTVQACKETTERDFYQSLSNLKAFYQIEPMETRKYGFPYNLVLAKWDIENKLKSKITNWDSLHLVQNSEQTFLATSEKCDTSTTLYYIPIVPLFQMLRDNKRKKNAHLLISVCSYLYHIANIPYYTNEETYLYWIYEMHKDWIEDEEDAEESQVYKKELAISDYAGEKMEKKLRNPINLEVFKQRLNHFKIRDTFDQKCWETACKAFEIYSDYPNYSIFRNAPNRYGHSPYQDDYYDEAITMEKYISFISNTNGALYDQIESSINAEFNEYGIIEEPTIYRNIDGTEITNDNFDFENRLFELINDLGGILNSYQTT